MLTISPLSLGQLVLDLFPAAEVVLDTREGQVTCTLIEPERGSPELADCKMADGTVLTGQEMRDLGLDVN